MFMKEKKVLIVLAIIVAAVFIARSCIYLYKKPQAIAAAESYLAEKYKTEMVYKKTVRPPISLESNLYLKVYFYPKENANIEFYVHVNTFPISIDTDYEPTSLNLIHIADTYLAEKFEYELTEILQNNLHVESVRVRTSMDTVHDAQLSETTDIYEAEKLMEYDVYIETTSELNSGDLSNIFQKLKELGFSPQTVGYSFGKEKSAFFDDWQSMNEEEIYKILEEDTN